jgi:hypothetical protein
MFSRAKLMLAVALGRMLGSAPLSLHKAAMDHNRTVDVLRAAEASRSIAQRLAEGAARLIPRRRAKGNGYKGLNGAQAMARRVRQIVSNQLTASNGLLIPAVGEPGKFVTGNGHGGLRYWPS